MNSVVDVKDIISGVVGFCKLMDLFFKLNMYVK